MDAWYLSVARWPLWPYMYIATKVAEETTTDKQMMYLEKASQMICTERGNDFQGSADEPIHK